VKLRVVHRTTYAYSETVTTAHHEARLGPREHEHQRRLSHQLEILPVPAVRRRRFDYFGNRTVHFCLSEPHRSLEVVATSLVELRAPHPLDLQRSPAWETVRDRLRDDRRRDVLDAYQMTFDSPHVALSPELAAYAAPSFPPKRPLLEAVRDLTRRVHADFAYDTRATTVSTTVAQVLAARRGVCQDFAHLQVGCLRALGLAGRYVSGYLRTRPAPGQPRLVGADASHAWIATFVPELGWVDFDPTNDLMPAADHITVAHGRDFADVTPLRGVILGGGAHTHSVSVDVAPADATG
jgi:transglutaminase-like putative cysteine protease